MLYNVTDYGVIGDGKTNNTAAINTLTKQLEKKGGTVYFPALHFMRTSIRKAG